MRGRPYLLGSGEEGKFLGMAREAAYPHALKKSAEVAITEVKKPKFSKKETKLQRKS